MFEAILLYCLATYFLFHLASRADILNAPRAWVLRTLPSWLTYPLHCAFCATFWMTAIGSLLGVIPVDGIVFLAAPVVNMVLDLVVRALVRANEPPVMGTEQTLCCLFDRCKDDPHWRAATICAAEKAAMPGVVVGTAVTAFQAGQMVQAVHGDGVKIPDDMRAFLHQDTPFNPLDHEQSK